MCVHVYSIYVCGRGARGGGNAQNARQSSKQTEDTENVDVVLPSILSVYKKYAEIGQIHATNACPLNDDWKGCALIQLKSCAPGVSSAKRIAAVFKPRVMCVSLVAGACTWYARTFKAQLGPCHFATWVGMRSSRLLLCVASLYRESKTLNSAERWKRCLQQHLN